MSHQCASLKATDLPIIRCVECGQNRIRVEHLMKLSRPLWIYRIWNHLQFVTGGQTNVDCPCCGQKLQKVDVTIMSHQRPIRFCKDCAYLLVDDSILEFFQSAHEIDEKLNIDSKKILSESERDEFLDLLIVELFDGSEEFLKRLMG